MGNDGSKNAQNREIPQGTQNTGIEEENPLTLKAAVANAPVQYAVENLRKEMITIDGKEMNLIAAHNLIEAGFLRENGPIIGLLISSRQNIGKSKREFAKKIEKFYEKVIPRKMADEGKTREQVIAELRQTSPNVENNYEVAITREPKKVVRKNKQA